MDNENGSAEAGNPQTQTDSGDNSPVETNTNESWSSGLEEDNRGLVEAKGWGSADDAIRSYSELESRMGKAITPPSENASEEEKEAFQKQLNKLNGVPEKVEDYQFQLDQEALPEDLLYDEGFANAFKDKAHNAGLSATQAQAVHDFYLSSISEQHKAYQEASDAEVKQAHEALTKEWGGENSETYTKNVELANRAIKNMGGDDLVGEMKQHGLLDADGQVKAPNIAKMLSKVGEQLYSEDSHEQGDPSKNNTEELTQAEKMYGSYFKNKE